ncbi:acyltransferase [uncultured Paraglaciecola sp.]|uniref:acyltransferase family protein n=1 Tax=uncultured Paraglaciecola sp. TaxID=1765024 RepID=UPI0030D7BBBD
MHNRIYYLDVLRALAIMMVFTAHSVLSFGAPQSISGLQFGGTGVDLFFLLSGWLIGSQLFAEKSKFNNVDVKRFWIRRWMRTLPAYYVVLLATVAQLVLTKDSFKSPLPYFAFIQNYDYPLTYFYISWSLSVEEQFYLVIAPLLVVLFKFKASVQSIGLLTLLITPSLFRSLGWFDSLVETHVRWDCCLMGVFLAHSAHHYSQQWAKMTKFKIPIGLTGLTAFLCFFYFRWYPPYLGYQDPSFLILALTFGCLVFFAVNTPVLTKPLGYQLIMHISTRSYSIYLLHPEALAICRRYFAEQGFLVHFASALLITLCIAEVLFRVVEMPFINMRNNFAFSAKRARNDD